MTDSASSPTPDLIHLSGARLVRASEPEGDDRRMEELIKRLTDGEPVEVRELDERFFEAEPEFRLRISGRHGSGSGDPEQ